MSRINHILLALVTILSFVFVSCETNGEAPQEVIGETQATDVQPQPAAQAALDSQVEQLTATPAGTRVVASAMLPTLTTTPTATSVAIASATPIVTPTESPTVPNNLPSPVQFEQYEACRALKETGLQAAVDCLEQLEVSGPLEYAKYNTLSIYYLTLDQFEQSLSAQQMAVEVAPEHLKDSAYEYLGVVLFRMERWDEALQALESALGQPEVDPQTEVAIHRTFGSVYEYRRMSADDAVLACTHYSQASELAHAIGDENLIANINTYLRNCGR